MPFSGSGPGKTAPKLLHDFLHFDPLRSPPNSNYLTDFTPPVGEGVQLNPPPGSCKHEYTPKWSQSVAPPPDSKANTGDGYKIATICKKCRIHADIQIAYPYAITPCPNEDYPLHHFQRHPQGDHFGHDRILCAWICSAPECNAHLSINYRKPKLEPADKDLLTDTERLRRRYEAVVEDDPTREGVRQAAPIDALSRLRRYIKDALNPEHTKRTFPANNKRFMEAFGVQGQDCAGLLSKLGFAYADEQWTLPQPPVLDDRLRASGDSHREVLEDIEMELVAWIFKIAAETNAVNPIAGESWASADRDVERLLAVQGYRRHISLRRTGVSNEVLPYFASLGALPDFADDLIEFAFDRQSLCDPEKRPYYFECLQAIAEHRNTEQLQVKVATLASQDLVSRRDLNTAYRSLQIDASEIPNTSDDRVLNLYHVLISDAGPEAQDNARQALYKIGVARGSQQLIKAAQQTMETYEDALLWLGNGVDKTTGDDMLTSVAAIKAGESSGNEETVRKAIEIIAKARNNSTILDSWLQSRQTGEYQMTPDEALRHLGVDGNFNEVDRTVLPTTFDLARQDRPGEQTEKAIAVLERALSSGSASHSPETWPVGLESHGNTCYLNSLLQFYFSVAPLRNIILDYDKYKFDTSKYTQKDERVGRLKVSMVEVRGGQKFAADLKHLFERMIKSPGDKVKPSQDLVCRAFLDARDYEVLSGSIESEAAAQSTQTNENESAIDDKATDEPNGVANVDDRHQSDASSVTLQAESNDGDGVDVPMRDAELPLTPPDSGGEEKEEKSAKAPPLPPRKPSTGTKNQALLAAQSKAAQQQDAWEVHDKIIWRLQAGMMAEGKDDENEEQQDAIRRLLDIGLVSTRVEDGVDGAQTHTFGTYIQLGSFSEDTDLYSLLDAAMDLQQEEGNADKNKGVQVYKTLRTMPPILQISIPQLVTVNGKQEKSTKCVKLDDELYMDRYCEESGSEVLKKRRACWGWRKQLRALKKEQQALSCPVADLDGPAAVNEAANYLNSLSEVNGGLESIGMDGLDFDTQLSATLAADAELQKERMTILDGEIQKLEAQLKDQFDEKKIKYRLAIVLYHRGGANSGHYWAYIHDFENDIWRMYNDERVEEVTKVEEILEARGWIQGTPTYAVYVRDDRKTELINPVCRAPEKPPTPEPSESIATGWEDITMENGESQAAQPPPLVNEGGGEVGWDEPRQVPQVNCTPVFHDSGMVKFVLRKEDASQNPAVGERAGSTSPKRRHDSTSAEHNNQDPKHPRLDSIVEGEGEAVERLVEGIDETQLDGKQK